MKGMRKEVGRHGGVTPFLGKIEFNEKIPGMSFRGRKKYQF
jgi:hypothetical protein